MTRARPYDRDTALDAAVNLFWTKGYHATSLKDIEAALKMKPGSIYAAFSSKEGLFRSALARYFETARAMLQSEIEKADAPIEGLADYLRSLVDYEAGGPQCSACMLIKTLLGTTSSEPAIAEEARDYLDQMMSQIVAAFDQAKASGDLASDADSVRLARRYQAYITAIRIELHRGTDPTEVAALADDLACEIERLRTRAN